MGFIAIYWHLYGFYFIGILHLGQIKFATVADLSGDIGVIVDRQPLVLAAQYLGISEEQLEIALVKKKSLVIRGNYLGFISRCIYWLWVLLV